MQQLELVPYLLYEPDEHGVLWIKFNRPERLNACVGSTERTGTVAKVGEYMRAGDDDPNVRVIVLTGVGRGFCAGADTRGYPDGFERGDNFLGNRSQEGPDYSRQSYQHGSTKLLKDISYIRKPTIAMVNGPAVGQGLDMALQCDIRYGCENSRFISHQQVGQILKNEAYYLPKLVGLGRALEFAFTGFLEAEQAYDWGLLNRLVPAEQLEDEVKALCARIVKSPPMVQWINKRIIRAAADSNLETTAVMTSNAAGILNGSEDAQESRRALAERRDPVFKGR